MSDQTSNDPNCCFTLRVRLYNEGALIVIKAYDNAGWDSQGRAQLTCEVRHRGRVVFPKGQLICSLSGSTDGLEAKELVLDLVAMRPGDTDPEYFDDYTPAQLEWVTEHGEALSMERHMRYCDDSGEVRRLA